MKSLSHACQLRHISLAASLAALGGCAMETRDEPTGHTSQAATVCAAGPIVQGVDVSVYQGTISWPSVKAAGIDFAIARISDGSALDTDFATNWSGMKSAGVIRGAYQYFEPGQDPMTQANIVISAVGMLGAGDLPVTADMETTGGQSAATIAANLQTWATAVHAGTGKVPMIYTAVGYWNSSVGSTSFASDPLWVANWGVTCPDLPSGWSNWVFWQYSDTGSVSGISGAVDLDEYNGTVAQLQSFAGGGSTSPDGGTVGYYAAQYVSQSWPLASTVMMMTTCQITPATITLKNVGTATWDSNTRLATTQPRDRKSVFGDSTWVLDNRAAQVTGTVAPGATYDFKFDFHAPPTAGSYTEYFGLVQDGVTWFSDPGQGGPPDDDIEANIQVTAGSTNCTVDPGVPDGGGAKADAGSTGDGGKQGEDASVPIEGGSTLPDAGAQDSSSGGWGSAPANRGGCSCYSAGARGSADVGACALGLGLLVAARRKRRTCATAPFRGRTSAAPRTHPRTRANTSGAAP